MSKLPRKPSAAKTKRPDVRARLARAHGHLHGVIDMIDEERPYRDILQQISAVRAALEKATAVILDDMLNTIEAREPREVEALRDALRTLA